LCVARGCQFRSQLRVRRVNFSGLKNFIRSLIGKVKKLCLVGLWR
jgi:hypothetical protein